MNFFCWVGCGEKVRISPVQKRPVSKFSVEISGIIFSDLVRRNAIGSNPGAGKDFFLVKYFLSLYDHLVEEIVHNIIRSCVVPCIVLIVSGE